MKVNFKRLLSCLLTALMVVSSFTFTAVAAEYPDISTVSNATITEINPNNPLDYKVGDGIVFKFQIKSGDTVVTAPKLSYSAATDDGETLTGEVTPVDGIYTVTLAGGLDNPGFVIMTVNALNASGVSVASYTCGAGADVEQIKTTFDVPDDFDTFWADTLGTLVDAEIKFIHELDTLTVSGVTYDCYELEIYCSDDLNDMGDSNYVMAYLTIPQGKTGLGAQMVYHGYDMIIPSRQLGTIVPQASICDPARITLSVCPHSVPAPHNVAEADKGTYVTSGDAYSAAYYETHLKNTYGYTSTHGQNETGNDTYFKYMIMRDVQAVNFLKLYFGATGVEGYDAWKGLWNGDIMTTGPSQGGFQSIAVAGLVPEVNRVVANIPWFADQGISTDSSKIQPAFPRNNIPYREVLLYVDTANFATRISEDCDVLIRAGLIDPLCPPSTIMSIYNNLNCKATLEARQSVPHDLGVTASYTQTISKAVAFEPEYIFEGYPIGGPDGAATIFYDLYTNEDGLTMEIYGNGTGTKVVPMDVDHHYTLDLCGGINGEGCLGIGSTYYPYLSQITKVKIADPSITSFFRGWLYGATNLKTLELHPGITSLSSAGDAHSFYYLNIDTVYVTGNEPVKGVADFSNITKFGKFEFEGNDFKQIILSTDLTEIPENCFAVMPTLEKIIGGSVAKTYADANNIPFELKLETIVEDMPIGTDLKYRLTTNEDGAYTMEIYGDGTRVVPQNIEGKTAFKGDLNGVPLGPSEACTYYNYLPDITKVKISTDTITTFCRTWILGATNLKTLELHPGITSLSSDTDRHEFYSLNLDTVYVTGNKPVKGVADFSNITKFGGSEFQGNDFTQIILSDELTAIPDECFSNITTLKTIEIPASVTSIAANAFYNCPNVTIIGEKGSYAETYANANNIPFEIVSGTIVEGHIGTNLTYSIEKMKDGTYTMVISGEGNRVLPQNAEGGTAVNPDVGGMPQGPSDSCSYYPYLSKITKVKISTSTITSFCRGWLMGATNLKTLELHPGITSLSSYNPSTQIGDCYSFFYLNIDTVYVTGNEPVKGVADFSNITNFGPSEFAGNDFTQIILSKDLTTIPAGCFHDISTLKSVIIPESVTSIAAEAFTKCDDAKIIGYKGSVAETVAGSNFVALDSLLKFAGYKVRVTGYNGLRSMFKADLGVINALEANGLKAVEFGGMLASTDKLTNAGEKLTIAKNNEGKYASHNFAAVFPVYQNGAPVGHVLNTSTSTCIDFACTVTDYTEDNYNMDVTFRGYIVLQDMLGNEYVVYADYIGEDGINYNSTNLNEMVESMFTAGKITEDCISYKDVQDFKKN